MLRSLHVEHYVLIDSLEIRFPEGFIVLTGQTGAGKSILLGALSLLMGAKADAGMISDGADSCVVEGEFDGRGDAALEAAVKAEDLDWADGQLLIRRVVSRSGRSRAFLNDEPVSLPVLTALSARLVDIHSQHQTLLLTDRKTQLSMLDFFAGDAETLASYRQCWRSLQERRAELNRVREEAARLREEQDFLRSRYETLSAAKLREGELAELEAEQQLLANAEQIKESLCRAESLFTPVEEDRASLSATLKDIAAQLEKAGRYIPSLLPLAERTASARLELDDIADELSAVNARTDVSTDRLTQVEDRIGTLYELMRRFSAAGEAELIAERDRLAGLLEGCETASDRQAALEKEVAALEKELARDAYCFYRPLPLRYYRPVVPVHYRPLVGAPIIDRILGITFGTYMDVSLSHLYYNGYDIDGYDNGIVYLRNVGMLNLTWHDVMLNYDDYGRLVNAQFVYSQSYRDYSRYDRVYRDLCAVYGSPIAVNDNAFESAATWFGGNSTGYVTLSFGYQAGRYYTTLSVGN